MRPCYTFAKAKSDTAPAVLAIHDDIGFWGTQAKDFMSALAAVKSTDIEVEINSPGGDVFAAVTMYNGLMQSGKNITTKVMGVAASAATIVLLAGSKRSMPKNTFAMVHAPSTMAYGTATVMREKADFLDKIGGGMASLYEARMGATPEAVADMLSKDTWMTADEALAAGLVTEVTAEVKATASFSLDEMPEHVKAVFASAKKPAAEDKKNPVDPPVEGPVATAIFEAATKAGLTEVAAHIAVASANMAEAKTRIAAATEIVALCKMVGKPEMSKDFIVANKSVADARTEVAKVLAKASDAANVDTTKKQAAGGGSTGPTSASMWDRHAKASAPKASK